MSIVQSSWKERTLQMVAKLIIKVRKLKWGEFAYFHFFGYY
jgi:hypothetical protein